MENTEQKCECMCGTACGKKSSHHAAGSGIYGLAFIGAAVYYIQQADSFGAGVVGILKAIIWPAMLVYKLLEFLKM
jgi:hypothetical protein